jgi:hypothetical protein
VIRETTTRDLSGPGCLVAKFVVGGVRERDSGCRVGVSSEIRTRSRQTLGVGAAMQARSAETRANDIRGPVTRKKVCCLPTRTFSHKVSGKEVVDPKVHLQP